MSAASGLQINTPTSLLTCEPALISWTGSNGPFFLSVLPGGQASGVPLEQFPQTSGTSTTWNVDIAAGTSVTMEVKDSTGAQAFSSQVTIGKGSSTSCVGSGSSNSTSASSGGASSSAGSSAGSSGAATSAGSGTAPKSSSPTGASSAAGASATASHNAAGTTLVSRAVMGLAAAAVALLVL